MFRHVICPSLLAQAAMHASRNPPIMRGCCRQEVLDLAPSVLAMPAADCELLYGRAGYLYALLFLRKHLGPEAMDTRTVRLLA